MVLGCISNGRRPALVPYQSFPPYDNDVELDWFSRQKISSISPPLTWQETYSFEKREQSCFNDAICCFSSDTLRVGWLLNRGIFFPFDRVCQTFSLSSSRSFCGAVRSGRLCFTSLALIWTRGIPLRGTTPQEVTFCSLSAEHTATRFIFIGNHRRVSVPLEGRDG